MILLRRRRKEETPMSVCASNIFTHSENLYDTHVTRWQVFRAAVCYCAQSQIFFICYFDVSASV